MSNEDRLEKIRQIEEEMADARQIFNYRAHLLGEPVGLGFLARLERALTELREEIA